MKWLSAIACAAGIVAAGCAAEGQASDPPHRAGLVRADWSDTGDDVALRVGQRMRVDLGGTGCTPSSIPVVAGSAVRIDSSGSDHGNSWARLTATGVGESTITASQSAGCGSFAANGGDRFVLTVVVTR